MSPKQQLRFFRSVFNHLHGELGRIENVFPSSVRPDDFSDLEEIHRNLGTAVEYARAIVARLDRNSP